MEFHAGLWWRHQLLVWANTSLPAERFQDQSIYGVGRDWPISYDDLEPDYCDAEGIMSIAGPDDIAIVSPRSKPYPLGPHRMTTPDTVMKAAQPDKHFALPTARASVATETRSACCDSARCNLCPVDAKFTALNGFRHLLQNENNSICFGAKVLRFGHTNGVVSDVVFENQRHERRVAGSLFVLGANALHSPPILLRSDINHPLTGRGINEQIGMNFEVFLDGMKNFDGSTITTGINLTAYEGDFRKSTGAALIYFENRWIYEFRKEWGRWRESLPLTIAIENPPQDDNLVTIDGNGEPVVQYGQDSPYGLKAADAMHANLPNILQPLPVEKIVYKGRRATESHIQGTLRMGSSRDDSVVDRNLLHHDVRNLVVVGTSLFPTCPPMNPSLTAAALSLWGARQLLA